MTSVGETISRGGFQRGATTAGDTYVLVIENESSAIFHLPDTGAIVIGRGDVELKLSHASVSRRHATIRIADGALRVADLGSHNGTRLNGEPVVESRRLVSGDVIMVGDVVLVLHATEPVGSALVEHAEATWRQRLVEELERAVMYRRELAIVAVAAPDDAARAALAGALRRIDVLGRGDDGFLLALLPELDGARAREVVAGAIGVAPLRAGLAVCPRDACDPDMLALAARVAARAAKPGEVVDAASTGGEIELGDRRVVVTDPAMSKVFALLERLATAQLPVLIAGETGVGKENAAYAVHHWSRRSGPFIAVNCAALGPDSLVDSELFGHDKGAFTGATAAKPGIFEAAAGGTVFLDEVGELPLAIQAKLLRVLENRVVTRLGEVRERAVDVRIVAATNRRLDDEVKAGRFRQDLLFRLGGATVIVPPLRDRRGEISVLARRFLGDACKRAGRSDMTILPGTMHVLLGYAWPGNVRELRNVMEYVAAAAPDELVESGDLPPGLDREPAATVAEPPAAPAVARATTNFRPIGEEMRELERRRMAEALVAADGVKTRAAQLIDMPIRTFTLKLKQYGL
jgi:two-component system response regulator AtoC